MRYLAAAVLVSLASPALADASMAFHDGKWPAAIKEGRAEATPASLVLAGRAQLTIASYEVRDKARALELVGAAEKDFDAALAKAPDNAEAQIQKAIAVGYRAKLTKSPGIAKEAKLRFEAARKAHPHLAIAWSGVAGWHGGAIASLGSMMAGMVLGAHSKEVEPGFAQAIKLDPTNPVIRVVAAQTLLDLDKNNADKAAATLQGIGQMPARDAFEALLRAQGVQIAAAIKAGDRSAAQTLSRRLQSFGTIG